MVRRWVIRGVATVLLTLCVGAWVGSYMRSIPIYDDGRGYIACLDGGEFDFGWLDQRPSARNGWVPNPDRNSQEAFIQVVKPSEYHFVIGTVYCDATSYSLTVPLWFPTLLSSLLLWLVWRKTRPKYGGRGFPVEVAGKGAGSSPSAAEGGERAGEGVQPFQG
jgi:hypothetical protein